MQYTTDVRIIRIMCTGRVDPTMVADAFIDGADGLMVWGCHFGTATTFPQLPGKGQMGCLPHLEYVGLKPARVAFNQCSSAEGDGS